jgi:hypothetical protein
MSRTRFYVLKQRFSADRLEGVVDGGPYEVWRQVWRHLVPVRLSSIGSVTAVHGMALQWRGWPHRVDSDGDDRSRRPDVMA